MTSLNLKQCHIREEPILILVLFIGCGETWFICLTFSPQEIVVPGTLMVAYFTLMLQTLPLEPEGIKNTNQMSHKSSSYNFPHFKYCIPNITVKSPLLCVSLHYKG
jgi:lipopolysaccharide export system protein LptC